MLAAETLAAEMLAAGTWQTKRKTFAMENMEGKAARFWTLWYVLLVIYSEKS